MCVCIVNSLKCLENRGKYIEILFVNRGHSAEFVENRGNSAKFVENIENSVELAESFGNSLEFA